MPPSPPLTITRHNINDALYEALFACELQQSDNPTTTMVAEAITRTTQRFGTDGCAGQMAQEFGDHPDAACDRMRWVRQLAARASLRSVALNPIEWNDAVRRTGRGSPYTGEVVAALFVGQRLAGAQEDV